MNNIMNMKVPRIIVDAQRYLDTTLVGHSRFEDAARRISSKILFPTDTKILLIIGPSGVGKSRLCRVMKSRIDRAYSEEGGSGGIASIAFEVPCDTSGHRFRWKCFYQLYLRELQQPFAASSLEPLGIDAEDEKLGQEFATLSALRHRSPKAVFLDESNHFALASSSKTLLENMSRLKSFANRSDVLHVCLGTYELAQMPILSGQLARRCEVFHFGRYRWEKEEDRKAWQTVVRTYATGLPAALTFNLEGHAEFLHRGSVGCVGVLKNWLLNALGHAVYSGRKGVTLKDLRETQIESQVLHKMLRDAEIGENRLLGKLGEQLEITNVGHYAHPGELPLDVTPASGGSASTTSQQGGTSRRVGEPNPFRPTVGDQGAAVS